MTVFKAYFAIIKRNILMILMYIGIFAGIAIAIQASLSTTGIQSGFNSLKVKVAVIDRDGGILADTLKQIIKREQKLVEIRDDPLVIQEELFYGNLEYIVIVPEGAEARLLSGEKTISGISVPNSTSSFYVESQVNSVLNQVRVCVAGGMSMDEACARASEISGISGQTELVDLNGNAGIRPDYNYYWGYMPYAFLGATVMTMSIVVMEFKKKDIRRRMQSSAVPFFMQNLAAVVSFAAVGAGIWATCVILQVFMYRGGIFTSTNAIFYLLNSIVFMIVSLSLGYLAGFLAKGPASLNGINNVISLGLCFLGGIFVPMEMLGKDVEKVAQFLPTYWYSKINGLLGDYERLGPDMTHTIWLGLLIQLLFASACFGIALAVRRMQLQEKE